MKNYTVNQLYHCYDVCREKFRKFEPDHLETFDIFLNRVIKFNWVWCVGLKKLLLVKRSSAGSNMFFKNILR